MEEVQYLLHVVLFKESCSSFSSVLFLYCGRSLVVSEAEAELSQFTNPVCKLVMSLFNILGYNLWHNAANNFTQ